MIITKLDVTFDVSDAMNYYQEVKKTCEDIRWKIPADFRYEKLRSMTGWSLTVPISTNPNEPFGLYNSMEIKGIENYQETKAAFGFGKAVINMFPMAYRVSLGLLPPGVHAAPHCDGGPNKDTMRGWISFVTDPDIKWITKEGVADLQPGNIYIIDVAVEHEFINDSDVTGVGMVFDMLRSDYEKVKQISGIVK